MGRKSAWGFASSMAPREPEMEQRAFSRINKNLLARLQYSGKTKACHVLNLSLHGAMLRLDERVPCGVEVCLEIPLPPPLAPQVITCQANTLRFTRHCLALNFQRLDTPNFQRLRKFLSSCPETTGRIEADLRRYLSQE